MMKSFWPTPAATQMFPDVARGMNESPKVVFSRTLTEPSWQNTRLIKDNLAEAVRKLKLEPGPGLVLMGSGSIIAQLAPQGVIDEYQIVVNPILLGAGRTMFEGVERKLKLQLTNTRTFENGNVLLSYEPTS
jgi:dihydrofolate reductase